MWRKGSTLLSSDTTPENFIFVEDGSLIIENVDIQDRGKFVCLVSNSAGSARRIIKLDVQGKQINVIAIVYQHFYSIQIRSV